MHRAALLLCALLSACALPSTQAPDQGAPPAPAGQVTGTASNHTVESLAAAIETGRLVLPATGGVAGFEGAWRDAPPRTTAPVTVVVFLHGSSGLGLPAIEQWQRWLAASGIASFAPNSFSLPGRLTYQSPTAVQTYERIHAMRMAEAMAAVAAVRAAPWADPRRVFLAGTSEGATTVARYAGADVAGKMIYAWSCEQNYFVEQPGNHLPATLPVLNVISAEDPFFSPSNPWLGNPMAKGHCADALRGNKQASVVLIPGAPHTLLNEPAARDATAGFLRRFGAPA